MWPDELDDNYTLESESSPFESDDPALEPTVSWREVCELLAWERGLGRAVDALKPKGTDKGKPTPRKPSGDVLFD